MILYPNCKINIGLRVVRRRLDGYHDLNTLFYPIYGLHDILEVEISDTFSFVTNGIQVDCKEEDNLIIRCYRMMQEAYPSIGPVRIRFTKHIPFGAGLGGGSSDAAHMAIAINQLFQLNLSVAELARIVRPLGADCPFFIYNTPCYAEGIGDELMPVSFRLPDYRVVMVKPDISVSTKEAYSGINLHPEADGRIRQVLLETTSPLLLHPDVWVNDFEQTVFTLYPVLREIKQHLLEIGAVYAAMSGSGSTLYGFFDNNAESSANARLRDLDKQFSSMVIFDDTLA